METTASPPAGTVVVTVPGDLTSTSAAANKRAFVQALDGADTRQPGWRVLRVDLTAARMVDSVGLNLLVSIIKRVKASGRDVEAVIAHPSVDRAIAFTRLDTQMKIIKVR
jgi:anti-anti-sigma factor